MCIRCYVFVIVMEFDQIKPILKILATEAASWYLPQINTQITDY